MSNLGMYQVLVELAKKVGGPIPLLVITAASGAIVCGGAIAGGTAIKRRLKNKKLDDSSKIIYTVHEDISVEGHHFQVGDKFKILGTVNDDEVCLVEILGDTDNPHVVSRMTLLSISDYGKDNRKA